jgi:hypothetical protein
MKVELREFWKVLKAFPFVVIVKIKKSNEIVNAENRDDSQRHINCFFLN